MYRNVILTIFAFGFWILIGIFAYTKYEAYKPIKIDESPYLNRLSGKWMRMSDNQKIEYLPSPTNIFSVLNTKYKNDNYEFLGYLYKEGDIQFSDISLTDSTNNIFEADMKNGDGTSYVNLRILNDTILKAYNTTILETYIKIKQ